MTAPGKQRITEAGRLARLGFADPAAAVDLLRRLGVVAAGEADGQADRAAAGTREPAAADRGAPRPDGAELIGALGRTADPDLALGTLVRVRDALADQDARGALDTALRDDPAFERRLLAVLGFSTALGDHLAQHPEHWRFVAAPRPGDPHEALLGAVGASVRAGAPVARDGGAAAYDALRVEYRKRLLRTAAYDLAGELSVDEATAELSDLADASLGAALAIARADVGDRAAACRLAVIGMGKDGGRELNYVSDVDVIFVAEPAGDAGEQEATAAATALAAAMIRACSQTTAAGALWPVDAALRPEGKAGPLVRSLASHLAYYERWAETWEFQALLKARPVAGDRELGEAYLAEVGPMVWRAADRQGFVADVRAMRRRIVEHLGADDRERQLKLGRGGLRDVEFAVQLLQLVHGRTDEALHSGNTLQALDALTAGGYVGRDEGPVLADAYRFLRTLEHRLQLRRMRRTHVLPTDETELRMLGRVLGHLVDPVRRMDEEWRRNAREVRQLHEKLFYRPLLDAVARIPGEQAQLTADAARVRLEALGYTDPQGALRHLQALTAGVSRTAAIQRTLLPVMLGWFADGADPDHGLFAFRQASEALGRTHWYLKLLRDESGVAERLAHVLAAGRYASDLLLRAPESVRILATDDELVPRAQPALAREVTSLVGRRDVAVHAVAAVRGLRRRELFRTASADLLGRVSVEEVGAALTAVTEVTLQGALAAAVRAESAADEDAPATLAVIAMGRLGGGETGYASDADVMFVYEPAGAATSGSGGRADDEAAARWAHAVADQTRRLLSAPCPDPPLVVDAALRPEGRSGPLVRSLASYERYYARWSSPWESQALVRARAVAGDAGLGARFTAMVDRRRWPEAGLDPAAVREIRRLKARMEAERLPRGADRSTHLKLGPGGLSDVEWVAQLLQLRHAHAAPALRTTGTLAALDAAVAEGLLDGADRDVLATAWRLATRIRNARMLVRGKPGDSFPVHLREQAAVAHVLGHPPDATGDLLEAYRRAARHSRTVFERLFYG